MARIILDTCIVSYLLKEDSRAHLYRRFIEQGTPHISFMTLAELHQWPTVRAWGTTQRTAHFLKRVDVFPVLHSNKSVCRFYAGIASIKGHPISHGDAWVAAVAMANGIPLITHNDSDFAHIPGLEILTAES